MASTSFYEVGCEVYNSVSICLHKMTLLTEPVMPLISFVCMVLVVVSALPPIVLIEAVLRLTRIMLCRFKRTVLFPVLLESPVPTLCTRPPTSSVVTPALSEVTKVFPSLRSKNPVVFLAVPSVTPFDTLLVMMILKPFEARLAFL